MNLFARLETYSLLLFQPALPDLDLLDGVSAEPIEWWWGLPEATREGILALLARLIARCVLIDDAADGGTAVMAEATMLVPTKIGAVHLGRTHMFTREHPDDPGPARRTRVSRRIRSGGPARSDPAVLGTRTALR
ncbi:MAG: hypothetical protein ACRDQH_14545 [Pseudonocardiaceae bacterium]